jgi:hypothetical protein
MNIFVVNQEHPAAQSLMEKFVNTTHRDGSIISVDQDEMDLLNSPEYFKVVHLDSEPGSGPLSVAEIDSHKKYVFMCDPRSVNIEDVMTAINRLNLNASIIRHRSYG